jgi:hypothetical protein
MEDLEKTIRKEQLVDSIVELIGRLGVILLLLVILVELPTLELTDGYMWLFRFIFIALLIWISLPLAILFQSLNYFIKRKNDTKKNI